MATIKKSVKPSKPVTVKVATKPAVETRAMKPVPAAAPKPVAPVAPIYRTISQAERQRMIEEAAYFRAENDNFSGDPDLHWSEAEKEVDARLVRERIRVS